MTPAYSVLLEGRSADGLAASLRALNAVDGARPEVLARAGPVWQDSALAGWRSFVTLCPDRPDHHDPALLWRLARGAWLVRLSAGDCLAPDWWQQASLLIDEDASIAVLGGTHDGYRAINRLGETRVYPTNPARFLTFPGTAATLLPPLAGLMIKRDRLLAAGGVASVPHSLLGAADMAFRLVDAGHGVMLSDRLSLVSQPSDPWPATIDDLQAEARQNGLFLDDQGPRAFPPARVAARRQALEAAADQTCLIRFGTRRPPLPPVAAAARQADKGPLLPSTPPILFPLRHPAGRKLHIVYFCQWYNDVPVNGVERVVRQLAQGMADRGHTVRLFTRGLGAATVGFANGVWVHQIPTTPHPLPADHVLPNRTWSRSRSLFDALLTLTARQAVDLVQSPNWDAEGLATVLDHRLRTLVAVYTPLKTWLPLNLDKYSGDPEPALEAERLCYRHADALLACGRSIIREIEQQYELSLEAHRLRFLPHGLEDMAPFFQRRRTDDAIRLLYVGRLERRKGIDLLLDALPDLCTAHPRLLVTIVGDDRIIEENDLSHRAAFEASAAGLALRGRVTFTGAVDDRQLWQHYADCDIVLSPSRFESFGLTLIEAMMFSRPVIASAVGGMQEIIQDGVDGFLFPLEDQARMREQLDRLIMSASLRQEIGAQARRSFDQRYSLDCMLQGAEAHYQALMSA